MNLERGMGIVPPLPQLRKEAHKERVRQTLRDALRAERAEEISELYLLSGRDLFAYYLANDPMFGMHYNELQTEFSVAKSNTQLQADVQEYAGGSVQHIGYKVMAARQRMENPTSIVLSPRRTIDALMTLTPGVPVYRQKFGTDAPAEEGVDFDGMMFAKKKKRLAPTEVYEYTSAAKREIVRAKVLRFVRERQQFPKKFRKTKLVIVVPNNYPRYEIPESRGIPVFYEDLPFSSGDLGEFISYVINDYRPGEEAQTLYELQKHAREISGSQEEVQIF